MNEKTQSEPLRSSPLLGNLKVGDTVVATTIITRVDKKARLWHGDKATITDLFRTEDAVIVGVETDNGRRIGDIVLWGKPTDLLIAEPNNPHQP